MIKLNQFCSLFVLESSLGFCQLRFASSPSSAHPTFHFQRSLPFSFVHLSAERSIHKTGPKASLTSAIACILRLPFRHKIVNHQPLTLVTQSHSVCKKLKRRVLHLLVN